tara:strand:- start:665 stop:871 length:207 start_codon:yes stop_codon:yes gene_type:complete
MAQLEMDLYVFNKDRDITFYFYTVEKVVYVQIGEDQYRMVGSIKDDEDEDEFKALCLRWYGLEVNNES